MTTPEPTTEQNAWPDAYHAASQAALRIAQASGAEIRERPLWPGSYSTVRYAEPLAGIRAAVTARDAAARVVGDYVQRAREDGADWLDIGRALGLENEDREPYDVAVAAYERTAGEGSLSRGPAFGFTCGTCGQHVRDNGPYTASPLDCEEGHAGDCSRMAGAVRAYRAQWEGGDDE